MLNPELVTNKILTLHGLFEAQVKKTPEAIALVFEKERLTYRELNEKANQLAHYLRSLSVNPETLVGICIERSIETIVGMLGILKAGGAFVPLDPSQPQERLEFILADTKVEVVLTLKKLRTQIAIHQGHLICLDAEAKNISSQSKNNSVSRAESENLAYTIYTSGSTGQPKGVMVSHRAICQGFLWMQEIFTITHSDRILQKLPLTFDFSFWELFWPLMTGARVVLAKPGGEKDPAYLVKLIAQQEISVLVFVPSVLQVFLSEDGLENCRALRMVFTGGEPLTSALKNRFFYQFPNCRLYDLFGSTENIVVTYWPCQSEENLSGCPQGRIFPNLSIYVVDEELQPVREGEKGELLVGGWGLAIGYLNRPELTAQKFILNPFKENSQSQLYRTGDLVRYIGNDTIEILGRIDQQVKIRGFRIELGEIEETLSKYPSVKQAAVIAIEDVPGDKRLVAYLVLHPSPEFESNLLRKLRQFFQQKLPDYMIPSHLVILESLPLNQNGKVNRRALPKPEINSVYSSIFVAPRTAIEEALVGIWAEIFKVERVGVYDNFFELGGHSLLAAQIIARIRERLQVELPFSRLLEFPTVASLAVSINEVQQQEQHPAGISLQPISRAQKIPLSFSQEQLWFLAQLEPDVPVYNEPCTIHFSGVLDVDALEKALNEIIKRHESLRTRFITMDRQPVQVIDPPSTFNLAVVDLRKLPENQREAEALRLATIEAKQPFDLTSGPLFAASLIQLADFDCRLFLTFHHIITDGVSIYSVFLPELAALYEAFLSGTPSPLAPLPIQYADFAVWQRQWLAQDILERQLGYWKQQLADLPVLQLPLDHPRLSKQTFRGERQCLALSKELTEALKALSQQEGVTLYMTLLAAFKTLLYRYTGQTDLVVGTVSAGRNRPEIEVLIGYFLNILVLRTDFSDNPSFRQLLERVREVTLAAYAHEDLPFEKLVEALQIQRNLSHNPLFQVAFVLEPPIPALNVDWAVSFLDVYTDTAKFDLTLELDERPEGIIGCFEYSTDLFEASTIDRMIGHFQTLLEGIVVSPQGRISELPLLTATEQHQVLLEWNNTAKDYPLDRCIHQLFEEQVERAPDAVAVVFEEEQLTYRELNYRANQLANYLRELGVGPEVLVGICVERSFDTIVGILGVLKAGGAYVPLDPTYPKERLAFMLEDSSVPVLLTQTQLVELLPQHRARVVCLDGDIEKIAAHSSDNLSSSVTPDNLAYIIYTSGSTGKPKGVLLAHRGLCNLATAQIQLFGVQPDSRVIQFASFSFDVATSDVVIALSSGATLYLATKDSILPGAGLIEVLRDKAITHADLPVSVLSMLPFEELPALRTIVIGGEACPPELVARWAPGRQFFNAYGPTEATVSATVALCSDGNQKPPIGRPIANTQVYILDTHNQPVPIGVPGELHIAGVGLAKGYLNRPDLTCSKFIPNPFSDEPGSRLYKTGDSARYLPDGNIEYLGRIDNQVKVRGFRIEPSEIEAALAQHSGVRETAVIARENVAGDKQLVAYIVPHQQPAPAMSDLRHFLKQQLPDYMVPGAFVVLDALPLTPNGKVDHRALPAPEKRSEREESFVAPRTPIEEMLASIWSNILSIDSVGIYDNFFELGGHSLLATQVISRVRDTLTVSLPLRSLFEAPTIAEFASRVENSLKNGQSIEALPLVPILRSESLPLSFAQARLWFLDQLQPESAFYNIPLALRLSGQLNIAALQSSLNEIIRRHEALRTNFATVGGQPVQVIASTLTLKLVQVDLRHLAESEREVEAQRLATVEAMLPFNLEREPLVRATVQQLDSAEHVLLLTTHHIISDGWSLGVFVREFAELYKAFSTGIAPVLPELSIQYADFAVWQRQWLTPEVVSAQLSYWKQQLKDAPALLELPADRPRPAVQTFQGAYHSFSLSLELSVALAALGKRAGVTLFMTLLAAFQTLLYRLSGQDDIAVGTPVANRNRREIEGLIGFFVNTLVLRTDLGGNPSFEELLGRVREVALGAYAHQDLPFEQLVEALQPARSLSYTPLFQVMFALDDALVPAVELPDVTVSPLAVETGTAKFDLTLSMENTASGLIGEWEYNTDLFDGATIARMAGHFQTLLEAIAANPKQKISELPLLTPAQRQQLIVEWNNTWAEYPQDKCIHQLFEEQVERAPDAVAVVFEEEQLTYRELNARANQLAHYLREFSVGPEVLVGLCVERSFEMIVGILGVLKAGGAYVPLDPAYPQERLAFMLEDSSVPVLLTQTQLVELLPPNSAQVVCLDGDIEKIAFHSSDNPSSSVTPDNLAYVIYTSGSTGKPKGVLLAHRGLCNLATAQIQLFGVQPDSRVIQFASFSFDVATSDVVIALSSGATLYLATKDSILPGAGLIEVLRDKAITHIELPVSVLSVLQFEELPALQTIVVGGEACPSDLVARWAPKRQFFNAYGPTEATVCATVALCNDGNQKPPIGRPIANTQVYILDTHNQPVPIGVPGELHIAGVGLAKGYLNRPDLTCSKFIPNPFSDEPGSRLYKTGDSARYLPDGNIEYLGRIDNQVKIRGFRIEPGEIEAALGQHPDVREVAVICREDTPGNKRLVAYVVSNLIPDRIPYHSECQLEVDGNAIHLHTEDISTGGVGLVGVPALCEGSRVRLHLQLPGEAEPRWLSGTVVWSHPPQAEIRFQLTPNEQAQIHRSVNYQLDVQEWWKTLQRTVTRNLRDYLKQKLPEYIIPSAFVLMKALPLTPNGKIDRRALPAPDSFHNEQEDKFIAPRTPTEAKLAAIWAETLGLKRVGMNDNFFELGGHSLLATQIISRIRQAFAIELLLRHLFEAPTIASLSKAIDTAHSRGLHEKFSNRKAVDVLPRSLSAPKTYIPISFAQQYVWKFQQLYPKSCAYNSPTALCLRGNISPEVLENSINEIIRRYEIMRTNFTVINKQTIQVISSSLTIPLRIVNLQNMPEYQQKAEAQKLTAGEFQHQFNLTSEPLIKATLVRLNPQEHWLLITMHHIITDGWSYGIFLEELEKIYNAFSNGLPSPLSEVSLQYADFTLWERQWLTEDVLQKQLDYWVQKLANIPASVNLLPTGQPQVSSDSQRASFYSLVIPGTLVASIKALSRSRGVTIFAILIAALKLLLYKICGKSDILILARTANRLTPTIEKMLGCFINDVLLRSQVDDSQTALMLLEQVNQTVTEAIAHQEIPFQRVVKAVEEISPIESLRTISVSMAPPAVLQNQKFKVERISVPTESELWDEKHFPIELYINFSGDNSNTLEIVAFYSKVFYPDKSINLMLRRYQEILQKLVALPDTQVGAFEPSEGLPSDSQPSIP